MGPATIAAARIDEYKEEDLPHFTPFDAKADPQGRADGRDLLAEFRRACLLRQRAQAHPADPGRDDR
jgi:hypothetical protein